LSELEESGPLADHVERILGVREVDCAVDCVGFEAKGHGGEEQPAIVLNQLMDVTRAAGAESRTPKAPAPNGGAPSPMCRCPANLSGAFRASG